MTPTLFPRRVFWLNQARQACDRMPPVWPLQRFVAVNPFLGLTDRPFAEVCRLMQRVGHATMLPDPTLFQRKLQTGHLILTDVEQALEAARTSLPFPWAKEAGRLSLGDLTQWLNPSEAPPPAGEKMEPLLSAADFFAHPQGGSWSERVATEIGKWCAAYCDAGQAAWPMPWRDLPLFAAWREAASVDANPELLGLPGFRGLVQSLPEDPDEAIGVLLDELDVPVHAAADYLHRLLLGLAGWSAHLQYLAREGVTTGASLHGLLAIRLTFEVALVRCHRTDAFRAHLAAQPAAEAGAPPPRHLLLGLIWQQALEISFRRRLLTGLQLAPNRSATPLRPTVQAVFCIDVRSEPLRRALEAQSPELETRGFAGFFGLPIEFVPFGGHQGKAQCPVLLKPQHRVHERLTGASPEEEQQALRRLDLTRRFSQSWHTFKTAPVASFSFVEAAGLGYAWRLVQDSFGLGRSTKNGGCQGHPELNMAFEDQVALARGALKNMGLTRRFARLVLLCGHGASTVNNPYGSSLDCGACGGHAGDANARTAAALLNAATVRTALAEHHGVAIPEDTIFIAGLHDTTTDEVRLFDTGRVPASHADDLQQLRTWLEAAGTTARRRRAARLGLTAQSADWTVRKRSRDWAQVRPEWGLAGNAAFVVAPRSRTRGLDLGGRVFLHDYDRAADADLSVLELILTAPMIVTNWINLQYYASSVDNRLWGSGDKVSQNVVGTFGILQGGGGDLRTGLPLQSVHDGERLVHEPLRLSVLIEAERAAIDGILTRHPGVSQLVENGWLHLVALEDDAQTSWLRQPSSGWQRL